MNKVDFKLDIGGLRELMKSSAMQAQLRAAGSAVASAAGSDYATEMRQGDYTAICVVLSDSPEAYEEAAEHNVLLNSVGAAGLQIGK